MTETISTNEIFENTGPQLHIRYDGRSFDVPLSELDVGTESTDAQIKSATAQFLGIPDVKLRAFVLDRTVNNLTLRPEAVFG